MQHAQLTGQTAKLLRAYLSLGWHALCWMLIRSSPNPARRVKGEECSMLRSRCTPTANPCTPVPADQPYWMDALVDVLLGLLSQQLSPPLPLLPLREACEAVFRAFAELLTPTGEPCRSPTQAYLGHEILCICEMWRCSASSNLKLHVSTCVQLLSQTSDPACTRPCSVNSFSELHRSTSSPHLDVSMQNIQKH